MNSVMDDSPYLRSHGFLANVKRPVMVAHRGASGEYPENTIPSFEAALESGADVLEMDARLTADNEVVLVHDRDVGRTTDGEARVNELTLEEIKNLDAGYKFEREGSYPFRDKGIKVPALYEVMERFPGQEMVIEIKEFEDEEIVQKIAELIKHYGLDDKVLITSASDPLLQSFRDIMPSVPTCGGIRESLIFYLLAHMGAARWVEWAFDCLFVVPGFGMLTESFKIDARLAGLHIYVWTINDRDEMHTLLEDGVEGILTNYPAILAEVVTRGGFK